MRIRRRQQIHEAIDPTEDVLDLLKTMTPPCGRFVITAWVSPGPVSEEDRERLHNHLIEAHGAVGVLSIGLEKPEATDHA